VGIGIKGVTSENIVVFAVNEVLGGGGLGGEGGEKYFGLMRLSAVSL
jgi:hypothetical protein